jgi:hypothetical protein
MSAKAGENIEKLTENWQRVADSCEKLKPTIRNYTVNLPQLPENFFSRIVFFDIKTGLSVREAV